MRESTNHWWMLVPAQSGGVTVQPLDEDQVDTGTEIYCGEACLLSRVSEIISVSRRPGRIAA
jgi:hypothetical protein